ncbi:hypothetical protein [Martelella sp. FOR1707]
MATGFIFGGNTGETYESLKEKQRLADVIAAKTISNTPKDVGEGLSALGNALLYRSLAGKAREGLQAGRSAWEKDYSGAFGGRSLTLVDALMGNASALSPGGYETSIQTAAQNSPALQAINDVAPGAPPIESGPQLASLAYANQGAIRDDTIKADLQRNIQSSIYDVFGPGYSTEVYSGGQAGRGEGGARTGSIRHDHGNAADIRVLDPKGNTVTGDALSPLGQYWQAQGYGGTGMEMRGGGVHLDNWTQDKLRPGMGMYWGYGDQGGSYTPEMQAALARGAGGEAPYFTMSRFPQDGPVPVPRDQSISAATVGSVEAPPLVPVSGDDVASIAPSQSPSQAFASQHGTPAPPLEASANVQSAPVTATRPQQQPTLAAAMMQRENMPQVPLPKLVALASSPYARPEEKALLNVLVQQQIQASDPLRQLQLEKAQAELAQFKNPQTTRVLSDQEKQQFGLPVGDAFQIKPDGSISKIGGGGVTVNNNMGGPEPGRYIYADDAGLPKGWRFDTETQQAEVIPGGPAAHEAVQAEQKQDKNVQNALTASDVVTSAAGRARDAAGRRDFGAAGTSVVGQLPWTDSAEVLRQVAVLKSNATIESLNAMRAASPTGGALGNVTEKEGAMLAARAGALDPNSPTFLRDLDDYERALLRVIHGKDEGDRIFDMTRPNQADADGWVTLPNGARVREKR